MYMTKVSCFICSEPFSLHIRIFRVILDKLVHIKNPSFLLKKCIFCLIIKSQFFLTFHKQLDNFATL